MATKERASKRLMQRLEPFYTLDVLLRRRLLIQEDEIRNSPSGVSTYENVAAIYDGYVNSPAVKELRDALKTRIGNARMHASSNQAIDDPDEAWLEYVVDNFDTLIKELTQQVTNLTSDTYVGHVMGSNPNMASIVALDQLVIAIGEHLDLGPVFLYYHAPELRNIHIYDRRAIAWGSAESDAYVCTVPTARSIDALITQGAQFVARRGRGVASEWSTRVPQRSVPNIYGYRVALRRVTLADNSVYCAIRFHRAAAVHLADLVNSGMIAEDHATLLSHAVTNEQSVIVAGAPGAGKTTLLRVLTRFIPHTAKLVVLENEEELRLREFVRDQYGQPWHLDVLTHVERQGTADGAQPITTQQLLAYSLQEDKTRIIVGEVRDGFTMLQLLKAANSGNRGVATTIHASSVEDVLVRIRALLLETNYPESATDMLLTQALDWIVHVAAYPQPDGTVRHRVSGIGQVVQGEGTPVVSPLWLYDPMTDTWSSTPLAERTMNELRAQSPGFRIVE